MTAIDTEYLRVRQVDTGHELSVSRTVYDFAPEGFDVLDDQSATDAGNNPLPPRYSGVEYPEDETAGAYDAYKVDELKAEIARRNADRDPDGGHYLSADGKKADLVAVLESDDANPPTPGSDEPANTGQ